MSEAIIEFHGLTDFLLDEAKSHKRGRQKRQDPGDGAETQSEDSSDERGRQGGNRRRRRNRKRGPSDAQ